MYATTSSSVAFPSLLVSIILSSCRPSVCSSDPNMQCAQGWHWSSHASSASSQGVPSFVLVTPSSWHTLNLPHTLSHQPIRPEGAFEQSLLPERGSFNLLSNSMSLGLPPTHD